MEQINEDYIDKKVIPYLYNKEYGPGKFYSKSSIIHFLTHFRSIFNKAVNWELIKKNPFSGKVPHTSKKIPRYLRKNEIEEMRKYFNQESIPKWQYNLVFLALNTGLRKMELFNLKWDHVDLFNEQIIFPGKGKKERIVPLNHNSLSILTSLSRHKNIRDNRVFWQIKHPDTISGAWRKFQIRSGIKAKFHDLRKTYASYYVMNGGNLRRLMDILGHEDYNTVLIYATLSKESIQKNKEIINF